MAVSITELKKQVCEHDNFINGVTPNGQDGAKSRITMIEDVLKRRDKASNYIIGACITVMTAVIIWLVTSIIPGAVAKISTMAMLLK
jgi:hypothetical protein